VAGLRVEFKKAVEGGGLFSRGIGHSLGRQTRGSRQTASHLPGGKYLDQSIIKDRPVPAPPVSSS
jgi:hypothetical protein